MTAPNRQRQPTPSATPRRPSDWLIPLAPVALGGVVLAAEATNDNLTSGLVWFGLLTAAGAVLAFGGRFESVREARGETEDERDRVINLSAMATAGIAMILLLTGFIVFELVQGDDPRPYTYVAAGGGVSYLAALVFFRRRT